MSERFGRSNRRVSRSLICNLTISCLTSNIECFGSTFSFVIFSVFSFLALLVCLCLFIRIKLESSCLKFVAQGRSRSRPVPAPFVGSFGTESSNSSETFVSCRVPSSRLIYSNSTAIQDVISMRLRFFQINWFIRFLLAVVDDHVPSCQLIYVDRRQSKMLEKKI